MNTPLTPLDLPNLKEDHSSQIPALQFLQKLGYTYLSPEQALMARGGKTTQVILDSILRKQLHVLNSIKVSSTRTTVFSDANIERGILALKDLPLGDGFMAASAAVFDRLTLGETLDQSLDGDKKSFTLQYIDWEHPENNVFHVTAEFAVMRSGSREHYEPDLVLFVNGIPFAVIECKRPDMKNPLGQAVSQHLRNQKEDGIRPLYTYAQLVLSLAQNGAHYATTGTEEKFWADWTERFPDADSERAYASRLERLVNTPLTAAQKQELFTGPFAYARAYFEAREKQPLLAAEQDRALLSLCDPERLLDLTRNFILFDEGVKKVARYQQYFAVKKTLRQLQGLEGGKRKGGVVWHSQGSGKSLTMVMLAQAIAMDKGIKNPKIVLVTDRVDLDDQITGTFRKCGVLVRNATTGQGLANLLEESGDAVITTLIHKFETAVRKLPKPLESPDIFVLVDEGHRTQHGTFHVEMQRSLPNACFIAFTGTPLFKRDKSTLAKFGTLIDAYPVDQAVKDGAVVPLLYEGRHAYQEVNEKPIDTYFSLVSEPLPDYLKADLKKKFSRADQLNVAEQKIYAIAWDISLHFRDNFKDRTPFKGQLVAQNKTTAIRYKYHLDQIGLVSSDVVISPPDDPEGDDSVYGDNEDVVKAFWKKKMDEHGNEKTYAKQVINRFRKSEKPHILIVVSKLLTGFDEPKNAVLYLTRKLQGHNLLQAIARVNRVYPDKEYGLIIDYYGVLGALDEALELYSSFQDFDAEDLSGTLTLVSDAVKALPQKHSEVWDLFKGLVNQRDVEAFQLRLKDQDKRLDFYDRLAAFARILKLALSYRDLHTQVDQATLQRYKDDLAFFLKLRVAVVQRYSDAIDFKQYEGQIQKLIDTHVRTDEVKPITGLVNIFDKDAFRQEVAQAVGEAAQADIIASRTARHISVKMEEDPAFYRKFSEMLKEVIQDHEQKRISDAQKLSKVQTIMENVLNHSDSEIPGALRDHAVAQAFYGLAKEALAGKFADPTQISSVSVEVALAADTLVKSHLKVDFHEPSNRTVQNKILQGIGDYLLDHVRDKYQVALSFEEVDGLAERILEVAKIRYRQ